jgi:hypothetical protein
LTFFLKIQRRRRFFWIFLGVAGEKIGQYSFDFSAAGENLDGFPPSTFGDFGRDRFLAILVAARVLSGALWDFSGVFRDFSEFSEFPGKNSFFFRFFEIFQVPCVLPGTRAPFRARSFRRATRALSSALRALLPA